MRKNDRLITTVFVAIALGLMVAPVRAQAGPVSYGGIEFPLGNKSFADEVVGFDPGSGTGESDGSAVIGPPDGAKDTGPSIIGAKGDVTLGKGGSITLKFTDNYLIDAEGLDLYVFEYGQEAEPFKVEISKDGSVWIDLGTVRGQPTGLDIHGKVAPGDRFSYVRITDANPYAPRDPKTIGQSIYVGADIDAVGAIGAEEKPASDGDGAPGVTDPPPPTPGACDWSGTWNTSRGKMELVQTGNAQAGADVSGTASLMAATAQNQTGTIAFQDVSIVAVVLGDKLSGTWSQPPSYGPPKDAGDIEFTISPDCRSFMGSWRYGYEPGAKAPWDGTWTGTRSGAATPPATPPATPATKQNACASAKPSITEGSVFKRATFTIGGTQPQEIKITQSAENFAIKKEYGGIVYQRIDGKSWGSLTLEPGGYILSCNGGGAMGLMSASVCVEYPLVGGAVPPGTPIVPPPGSQTVPPEAGPKEKLPREEAKQALPYGPIEKIVVRSADPNDSPMEDHLSIVIGKEKRFWAWGEDAAGHKKSVIVTEWMVIKDKNVGTIENDGGDGVFKAGPNPGEVKIMAKVKVAQIDITGVFHVTVVAVSPNTFIGHLELYDENGNACYAGGAVVQLDASGYRNRKEWEDGGSAVRWFSPFYARTDARGKFVFVVPVEINHLFLANWSFWISPYKIPATPPGFKWERKLGVHGYSNDARYNVPVETDKPVLIAPEDFGCFKLWLEKLPNSVYIVGKVTHRGKPVEAEVNLFYHTTEKAHAYSSPRDGTFTLCVDHLKKKGSYRLTAQYQPEEPNITTVHNLLKQKEDIWVDLPLNTTSVTINIEMITFAEKIGYTGP
jgi:hypothetical protein